MKVSILGAGSWGTALAIHLARVGHDVSLWARDPKVIDTLTRTIMRSASFLHLTTSAPAAPKRR